jgi:hypothetical protein
MPASFTFQCKAYVKQHSHQQPLSYETLQMRFNAANLRFPLYHTKYKYKDIIN